MKQCGAKTRAGTPCKQKAGWGTDHVGQGRCKLHGGNAGRPPIHGRYSIRKKQLAEKHERFLDDPRPYDLTEELALTRALMENYLDRFDGMNMPANDIERVVAMVETISRVVQRIARILNDTALTQAEIALLQAALASAVSRTANRHFDDSDERQAFVSDFMGEVRSAFGHVGRRRSADSPKVELAG